MSYKRKIGLHLRFKKNLTEIAEQIQDHGIKIFQFFLIKQNDTKYLKITKKDLQNFLVLKKKLSLEVFIHSSYWINPATGNKNVLKISKKLLKNEILLAKKLQANYLVLHAGCATEHKTSLRDPLGKIAGIKTLAKILNTLLKKENKIQILLENTAHTNRTIGSDLADFSLLKKLLNEPKKVNFCLDLSHAFAYGYDLSDKNKFIEIINKYMGLKKIKLIHLNDSAKKMGSKIDKHEIPGKGFIGTKTLKNIINHPKLKKIPLILELPPLSSSKNKTILNAIKKW